MSGRSAYVRKKITETNTNGVKGVLENRKKSLGGFDDATTIDEAPTAPTAPTAAFGPSRQDLTGPGSANAWTPRLADLGQERDGGRDRDRDRDVFSRNSSVSSGSNDGRRVDASLYHYRPLDDIAYARARRPTIRTEDVSGISKSGMRSVMDQKSDQVRKGLVKAFTFRSKKSKMEEVEVRPESAATVRPHASHASGLHGNSLEAASEADVPSLPSLALDEHNQPQYPHPSQMHREPWGPSNGPVSPPPTAKLPPLPPSAMMPQMKRWMGTGRPAQRWNKLRKDPELWDPNGDVLVYLGRKGQHPRPNPSFRLSSRIIEATESHHLIHMLRKGSTEDNLNVTPPLSPQEAPPMLLPLHHDHNRGVGQPISPLSEDTRTVFAEADGQISYEMYFPPPSNASKTEQLLYNITTRNVIAILCHASLVGISLYQALSDLHARMEQYMPQAEVDNLLTITRYVSARGIDDVRNDPETAISLLAWCEDPKVRWEEGWRESFLHATGILCTSNGRLVVESCADFKRINLVTRALLDRASLETQLRVQGAEERLACFSFEDMWPSAVTLVSSPSGPVGPNPAKESADRLQRFFVNHYRGVFGGRWPPLPSNGNHHDARYSDGDEPIWLTRTVAQTLQKDFGALYDYLVNRDIIFDGSETRSSRKWLMISESGNKAFDADTKDLPMTDMLIEFDNKQRFPHIPHPYPLVPESIPPQQPGGWRTSTGATASSAKVMLKWNKADKMSESASSNGGNAPRSGALERRVQLAYTEATNIYIFGSDFTQSDLIDAFVRFEKSDRVGEVDPSLARRGRWVLIYGILQTLASVSVDAPNVRFSGDVPYHLGPRLKGARLPPWSRKGKPAMHRHRHTGPVEASHELSHCWLAPLTWNGTNNSASEGETGSREVSWDDNNNPRSPARALAGYEFPYDSPGPGQSHRSSVLTTGSGGSSSYYYHTGLAWGGGGRSVLSLPSGTGTGTGTNTAPSSRAPTLFSYAGSVVSYAESDTAATATTATRRRSSFSARKQQRPAPGSRRGTFGNPNNRGPAERIGRASLKIEDNTADWPVRAQSASGTAGSQVAAPNPDRWSRSRSRRKAGGGGGGSSGLPGPDEEEEEDYDDDDDDDDGAADSTSKRGSFYTAVSGQLDDGGGSDDLQVGGRGGSRSPLSPSDTSSLVPVIRDFDELGVDDIMPHE